MILTLEVPDSKAAFFMELLANFTFIKAKTVSAEKTLLLEELKEAVDNMNKVKKGVLKARPVKELLNEL
jgi:predicted Zn-dependent protease